MKVHLTLDDEKLVITPGYPEFKDVLQYEYKTLVAHPQRPWDRVTVRETRLLYNVTVIDNIETLTTHQGFWLRCVRLCIDLKLEFVLDDRRINFPKPQLSAMYGFRFSQQDLLTKFLSSDYTGCLKAPTRYGKSTCIINTMRAFPNVTTVFTCPGEDLLRQSVEDFQKALPGREVVQLGGGSKTRTPSKDITVCSMDSLHLCDHARTRLVIIDEPHAIMTDTRLEQLKKFNFARKLSFGATLEGRYDQRDLVLEGFLGPILAERTYREAVTEGAICELVVIFLELQMPASITKGRRNDVYKRGLYTSENMAHKIAEICSLLPENWQHLIFIEQQVQAELVQFALNDETPIAMAKLLKKKDRKVLATDMRFNNIKRCISSDIFATGVTFHDIRCVINATGGGGAIGAIQKPGRLAEIRPNKKCGVMVDFLFTCPENPQNCLTIDSWARHKVYKNKGYVIKIVKSTAELQAIINENN